MTAPKPASTRKILLLLLIPIVIGSALVLVALWKSSPAPDTAGSPAPDTEEMITPLNHGAARDGKHDDAQGFHEAEAIASKGGSKLVPDSCVIGSSDDLEGDDAILLNCESSNETILAAPYSYIRGNWLRNVHMVVNTKNKSAIIANRFENGCWFTIDGVNYKTSSEVKKAVAILEKNENVTFYWNQIDLSNQPGREMGAKP